MTTGQYVKNALFYFIKLIVLIAILLGLLDFTGYMREDAMALILGNRGMLLLVVIVVWSALYPKIGFMERTVAADMASDRESIVKAFDRCGYALVSEEAGAGMTFRASSLFKRLWLAFGDKVTVKAEGQSIVIYGIRKAVAQAEFRIEIAKREAAERETK